VSVVLCREDNIFYEAVKNFYTSNELPLSISFKMNVVYLNKKQLLLHALFTGLPDVGGDIINEIELIGDGFKF
jgi:hypothetical protein